jgi:DNA (cytosine-5)-methyltransferase 1
MTSSGGPQRYTSCVGQKVGEISMTSGSNLKVLDLFSGIGMFSYGLERTGLYKTVAFCEWDKTCQEVLKKHWPSVYCYKDIEHLEWRDNHLYSNECGVESLTSVDVICGGFPCQDISYAGKGDGIEGSRSSYWKHYWRLINEIKPKAAIIENVSALRRRGLDVVLSDLDEIGYDAEWHCIPASYVGACHQRDRVWILAYCRSQRGKGLVPLDNLGEVGQGGWGGKEDLQQVYSNPFGRSNSWPEPLLRRVDVPYPRRLDRLKQVGNTVYWPIVEKLGYHLHRNIT